MDRPHARERPGRWDAWLDPAVPLRVAVAGGDPARLGALSRWARVVPLEEAEAATLDGLVLPARGPTGRFPHVPALAADDLADARRREGFAEAVFARNRWRALLAAGADRGALVDFQAAHKLLVWAHDEQGMRRLGKLVGDAAELEPGVLCAAYEAQLAASLGRSATPGRQTNVLHHALGYFKQQLSSPEKQTLLDAIDAYRAGEAPLAGPIEMLREHTERHGVAYLARQLWFDPIPAELSTRGAPHGTEPEERAAGAGGRGPGTPRAD